MAKRAFVVGSDTGGLAGAVGDALRMGEALAAHGFEVDVCAGRAATREGILDGYGRLIGASGPDDAAFVYYSGHGAYAEGADFAGGGAAAPVQCIVPADFHKTTDETFYGVTAAELSLLLARLTAKTPNVAVALDCCHAAGMSRDPRSRPKALRRPIRTSVAALRAAAERVAATDRDALARLDGEGNPRAVRLVATGLRNYAWEYARPSGEHAGAFTDALLLALGEARGQRVTWEAVGDRVRELVLAKFPAQRPEVEGPARRLLFEREEGPATNAFVVVRGGPRGRHLLRGGRIHGVRAGDEFALAAGPTFDAAGALGTAKVVDVSAAESDVDVTFANERATLLDGGARAFPVRSAAPRRPVWVEAPEAERAALGRAIAADPLLRVGEGADAEAEPFLARVRVAGGRVELLEPWGTAAFGPSPYDAASAADVVNDLRQMAAVLRLRELESEPAAGLPEGALDVSWGRVDGDRLAPLAAEGEVLGVGDAVYVRVRNEHPDRKNVYVSIVDLGVAKKITLLTKGWPSGRELRHGEEYVFGRGVDGAVRGAKLRWPEGLPADEPRPETLVVVATGRPTNMLPLETRGLAGTRAAGGSALEQLVRQVQNGGTRDVHGGDEPEGFLVRHLDFQLAPWPAPPRADEGFAIDDRPPASLLAFVPSAGDAPAAAGALATGAPLVTAPRAYDAGPADVGARRGARPAAGGVPRRLALRLNELVVHDVRTLFGGADVRVDALVVTRRAQRARPAAGAAGGPGPGEPFAADTRHFPNVRDGERLPFDDVLLYEGDVRDFVDLRLWVSRDREGAKTLSEMLYEELNSGEFRGAATTLLALTAVAPPAGAVVSAIGASAAIGKIAWRLLSQALPKSIGVYQTSLLAADGFNVGRHPAEGHFRAQGFSFGYEVRAAG